MKNIKCTKTSLYRTYSGGVESFYRQRHEMKIKQRKATKIKVLLDVPKSL